MRRRSSPPAHALVIGVGRPRCAGRAIPRGGRRGHASRSATPTPSTSPTCSGRSCTRRRTSARARSTRAARRLAAINPEVRIERIAAAGRAPPSSRRSLRAADVVLDCCDNFATRHAVNAACVRARKPLVSGAARALRRPGRGVRRARREARPAITACSAKATSSRRRAARRWACSRRWSASSARCRRPKRSSCSPASARRSLAGCLDRRRARHAHARARGAARSRVSRVRKRAR